MFFSPPTVQRVLQVLVKGGSLYIITLVAVYTACKPGRYCLPEISIEQFCALIINYVAPYTPPKIFICTLVGTHFLKGNDLVFQPFRNDPCNGIFTYMWLKCMVNVGKYAVYGAFGHYFSGDMLAFGGVYTSVPWNLGGSPIAGDFSKGFIWHQKISLPCIDHVAPGIQYNPENKLVHTNKNPSRFIIFRVQLFVFQGVIHWLLLRFHQEYIYIQVCRCIQPISWHKQYPKKS